MDLRPLIPLDDHTLRLRRLRPDDAAAYAAGTTDPDVRAFAHLPEPHYTAASVTALIGSSTDPGLRTGELAVLAVADVADDSFVGSLVLFDLDHHHGSAEIGFWVAPGARGRGVAARAVALGARFAAAAGLARLRARAVPANVASARVLERAGFVVDGPDEQQVAPSGETVWLRPYLLVFDASDRLDVRRSRP